MSLRKGAPRQDNPGLDESGLVQRQWYTFLTDEPVYEKTGIATTAATVTALTHNLKDTPRTVLVVLSNVTAEYGYAVGEEIPVPVYLDGVNSRGAQVSADRTTLRVIIGANGIAIMRRDTPGALALITGGRWTLTVRAWL